MEAKTKEELELHWTVGLGSNRAVMCATCRHADRDDLLACCIRSLGEQFRAEADYRDQGKVCEFWTPPRK